MAVAADALGILRLAAAAALPGALARGVGGTPDPSLLPLGLVGFGAATDFVDGRLARRAGRPTRHGAVLDNVADIALVLAATGAGAWLGLVPWAAPASIALAFTAYALASLRGSARQGSWRLARTRLGHAAGVANYTLALLVAGAVALPGPAWPGILATASGGVVVVNLAAVAARFVGRR